MKIFDELIKRMDKVNANDMGRYVFSKPNIQRWIIETTVNRLNEKGTTSDGSKLRTDKAASGEFYSEATINLFYSLGIKDQIDHVDLKVKGDFHRSFKTILKENMLVVYADFEIAGEHIADNFTNMYSQAEFENVITGLSNDEIDYMINNFVIKEVINYLNKTLSNANN